MGTYLGAVDRNVPFSRVIRKTMDVQVPVGFPVDSLTSFLASASDAPVMCECELTYDCYMDTLRYLRTKKDWERADESACDEIHCADFTTRRVYAPDGSFECTHYEKACPRVPAVVVSVHFHPHLKEAHLVRSPDAVHSDTAESTPIARIEKVIKRTAHHFVWHRWQYTLEVSRTGSSVSDVNRSAFQNSSDAHYGLRLTPLEKTGSYKYQAVDFLLKLKSVFGNVVEFTVS